MSPRKKLLVVAALFIAPPLFAYLLFYAFPSLQPQGTTNYGTLVSPARPLPELQLVDDTGAKLELERKWTMVYVGGSSCDEACAKRVYLTRQIWKALDKRQRRAQRLYIAPSVDAMKAVQEQLADGDRHLLFAADLGAKSDRASEFFSTGPASDATTVYLLDPLGNWLMVYTGATLDPKGVLRDLKKLMRFSQIG